MVVNSVVALAGGFGAAKFLRGLARVVDGDSLYVIGNVGDNLWVFDLYVAPDIDIVTYALAGVWDDVRGWGIKGEGFQVMEGLRLLGLEGAEWFNLGDRDFATCVYRTHMMRRGFKLSQATEVIRTKFGVRSRITPATDNELTTQVYTLNRWVSFEEYYVKYRYSVPIEGLRFAGADSAEPPAGVVEAINTAHKIIVCPSNPLASVQPILSVKGILEALKANRHKVVAISPIVGGKAIKGPADAMLKQLGYEPSVVGVAKIYREFVDTLIIDSLDSGERQKVAEEGVNVRVMNTMMNDVNDAVELARRVLAADHI
ncbi:MAG: 2-phospho-L-lactate transferase [Thermoprotei archaeon]